MDASQTRQVHRATIQGSYEIGYFGTQQSKIFGIFYNLQISNKDILPYEETSNDDIAGNGRP